MFKAIQTSVSGLMASTTRMNVAAGNIVNAQVTSSPGGTGPGASRAAFAAYAPQRTAQTTTPSGGVSAKSVPVTPASLSVYDPASPLAGAQGQVNIPNVSLPVEIAEMTRASHAYKANAAVLKTLDETLTTLLKA